MAGERRELELLRKLNKGVSPREELKILRELDKIAPVQAQPEIPQVPPSERFGAQAAQPTAEVPPFLRSAGAEVVRAVGGIPQLAAGLVAPDQQTTDILSEEIVKRGGQPLPPSIPGAVTGAVGGLARAIEGPEVSVPGRIAGGLATGLALGRGRSLPRVGQRLSEITGLASALGGARFAETPKERAITTAVSPALTLPIAGTLEAVKGGIRALHPQALTGIRKILQPKDKLAPQIARQRKAIAEFKVLQRASKKPLDALLSEVTSSPKVAAFEKAVASSSRVSDRAFNEVQALSEKALSNLNNVAISLAKRPKGEVATGRLLKSAVNRAVNTAFVKRSAEAARNELGGYGRVRQIAGTKKFVPNDNLVKAYEKIIIKANNVGNRTLASKAAKEMRDVTAKLRNVDEMLELRSHFSDVSKGVGRVISDKLDPKESSKFGASLLRAYQKDIQAAEGVGNVSEALKAANKTYAQNSASIERIRNSALGKLLDVKGENPLSNFAKKLKTMDSEQLTDTMNIIRNVYPNAEDRVGRFIITEAMKKARLGGEAIAGAAKTGITGKQEIVSLRKFIDAMPTDEKFKAIFRSPKTQRELKIILSHMRRLADRPEIGGAGGQPASTTKDIAGQIAGGGAGQAKIFAARFASGPIFNRFFEKALFTEEGRKAMLIITNPKPVSPAVIAGSIRTLESLVGEE